MCKFTELPSPRLLRNSEPLFSILIETKMLQDSVDDTAMTESELNSFQLVQTEPLKCQSLTLRQWISVSASGVSQRNGMLAGIVKLAKFRVCEVFDDLVEL